MSLPSFINRGRDVSTGGAASIFLGWKADESRTIVPLAKPDDILSYNKHGFWQKEGLSPQFPCIKENCPGCELGDEPRFYAVLPVATESQDGEIVIRLWSMSITVFRQVLQVADAIDEEMADDGGFVGSMIRVKRSGEGRETKYTLLPTAKRYDISNLDIPTQEDIIEQLGPLDRDGIVKLLVEAGIMKADEDEEEDEPPIKTSGKAATKTGMKASSKKSSSAGGDWS